MLTRRAWLLSAAALAGCSNGTSPEGSSLAAGTGAGPNSGVPTAVKGLRKEGERVALEALPPYAPHHLRQVRDKLAPLFTPRGKPKPGEWLASYKERGQSFDEYLKSNPTVPTAERRVLVVQPIGALGSGGEKIVALTADYLTRHFGLPSRVAPAIDVPPTPAHASRKQFGTTQLLSGWLLEKVLPPLLPKDAAALIGFTASDLWPGQGWNFVFGEASLSDRVGVWSLHRYGDATQSPQAFRLALERALKIAVHETGHMFSLPHCTAYHCIQSGTNSLDETDESPLWLCPECLPKIAWATSTDPRERLEQTRAFCAEHGLDASAAFLARALAAIS